MMAKGRRVHTDQHPNRLPYHPHHIQFRIGHEILGRPIWPGRPSKFGRARTLPGNGWVNATDVRMGKHARVLPIFIDRNKFKHAYKQINTYLYIYISIYMYLFSRHLFAHRIAQCAQHVLYTCWRWGCDQLPLWSLSACSPDDLRPTCRHVNQAASLPVRMLVANHWDQSGAAHRRKSHLKEMV